MMMGVLGNTDLSVFLLLQTILNDSPGNRRTNRRWENSREGLITKHRLQTAIRGTRRCWARILRAMTLGKKWGKATSFAWSRQKPSLQKNFNKTLTKCLLWFTRWRAHQRGPDSDWPPSPHIQSPAYPELAHPSRNALLEASTQLSPAAVKSFHLQCYPSAQVLLGWYSLTPDLGFTNQLCQITHFSEEPAGPPSKEDRGREHGLQGITLLSKSWRPWGKWCMCSPFQCRDSLITSYHLQLTTEASKIQMRDRLVRKVARFYGISYLLRGKICCCIWTPERMGCSSCFRI